MIPPTLEGVGAPVDEEVEVTAEMIKAGAIHMLKYHPDRGRDEEETARRVYVAMALVVRLSRSIS